MIDNYNIILNVCFRFFLNIIKMVMKYILFFNCYDKVFYILLKFKNDNNKIFIFIVKCKRNYLKINRIYRMLIENCYLK